MIDEFLPRTETLRVARTSSPETYCACFFAFLGSMRLAENRNGISIYLHIICEMLYNKLLGYDLFEDHGVQKASLFSSDLTIGNRVSWLLFVFV